MRNLIITSLATALLLSTQAKAQVGCDMGDCPQIGEKKVCWTKTNESCMMTLANSVITKQEWGEWVWGDELFSNCCNDSPITGHYTKTTGESWSYCFSLGFEISGNVKITFLGGEAEEKWKLNVDEELCHSRSVTIESGIEFTVPAHSSKSVRSGVRTAPTERIDTLQFTKIAYYKSNTGQQGCGDLQGLLFEHKTCGTQDYFSVYTASENATMLVNAPCPDPLNCPQ